MPESPLAVPLVCVCCVTFLVHMVVLSVPLQCPLRGCQQFCVPFWDTCFVPVLWSVEWVPCVCMFVSFGVSFLFLLSWFLGLLLAIWWSVPFRCSVHCMVIGHFCMPGGACFVTVLLSVFCVCMFVSFGVLLAIWWSVPFSCS